ncbi:MAG: dihydroorotate dehydrogenase [Chloroflexi bacterium]|nr:dihydroorotate dehydrogenase [Chloroflexota bacterium]
MDQQTVPDLSIQLGPLTLQSPLILAASPWGSEAARYVGSGIGALTMNSVGPEPRRGHPPPVMHDWAGGMINAVGLDNLGAAAAVAQLKPLKADLQRHDLRLIASIFAHTAGEFETVAQSISALEPDLLEVNISCPNVEEEFGRPFATQCTPAAQATAAARAGYSGLMSVKLAPNVPDVTEIAQAVIEAGADILTVSNTMPGMVIDIEARRPVLSNKTGGVSGEALRPIAVRMVYELSQVVTVPIIGTGGVVTGRDAVEMIMAGATAVGLATVAHRHGPAGVRRVLSELDAWLSDHRVESLDQIRGAAHTG